MALDTFSGNIRRLRRTPIGTILSGLLFASLLDYYGKTERDTVLLSLSSFLTGYGGASRLLALVLLSDGLLDWITSVLTGCT